MLCLYVSIFIRTGNCEIRRCVHCVPLQSIARYLPLHLHILSSTLIALCFLLVHFLILHVIECVCCMCQHCCNNCGSSIIRRLSNCLLPQKIYKIQLFYMFFLLLLSLNFHLLYFFNFFCTFVFVSGVLREL